MERDSLSVKSGLMFSPFTPGVDFRQPFDGAARQSRALATYSDHSSLWSFYLFITLFPIALIIWSRVV